VSALTKLASRVLRLPPATHPELLQQADLAMTTSDGRVLLAHRWVPRGFEDGGLPTLLMRSPYGRRGLMAFEAPLLAERGYNVLIQSVRGTHGSEGSFVPFEHETADGAEALSWVRRQPWCDGRLGTWGGSYCGYTQLAAAAEAEPGLLSAMSVGVTSADLRCLFKPYGAFTLMSAASWVHGLDPEGRRTPLGSIRHLIAGRQLTGRAHKHLPMRETDVVLTGQEQQFYRDWIDAPPDSPYWDRLDVTAARDRVQSPIALHAGWFDIFAPGQLDDAAALLQADRDVRLVIGPWHHAAGIATKFRETLELFDRALRGRPAPEDARPVRVQLHGDKTWWALPTWPVAHDANAWHLTPDGELAEQPAASSGELAWTADPGDPAPSIGGAVLTGGGPKDNAAREARGDVIVFTSAPLTEDLTILGQPRFTGRVAGDTASYDVVVRLCVVDTKGVSRNVSDGMQRMSGGEADVDIAMWPIGVRVRRGQCLRLQVAGALHPLWARDLHTGTDSGAGAAGVPAHQQLLLGPDRPAVLTLPAVHLSDRDLATDMTRLEPCRVGRGGRPGLSDRRASARSAIGRAAAVAKHWAKPSVHRSVR
jgi:putative CocE/NonD family hydrolase